MKKLSAVVLSLMLCVSVSFAARGSTGSSSSSSSSSKSSSRSSSSSGKFGIGYSKFEVDTGNVLGWVYVDEIAGRFWFNDKLGLDVKLGFGSGDATTRILVGANLIGTIKNFNSLKIYWLAGLSFGSYKIKDGTVDEWGRPKDLDNSVLVVQGGVGAEYFVLPCLSVLTEMGIRYISAKPDGGDSVNDFGVFADWLPQAGVRFYF